MEKFMTMTEWKKLHKDYKTITNGQRMALTLSPTGGTTLVNVIITSKHEDILKSDDKFRYMLLSRLQHDCNYYLGNGNRYAKHLWAGDEKKQIETMKVLWNSFADDSKPEWLTYADISNYETKMTKERS